jgi:hypothetical protein
VGAKVIGTIDTSLREAWSRESELRLLLFKAHENIGRLLCCAKQAYMAQLHPGSQLSLSLLTEIHRHEPGWKP